MFRSRSRSRSSSAISRSFSARILCGGDAIIRSKVDSNAVKSKSSIDESFKNNKLSLEEDLKLTKQKLSMAELEKKRALDQLRRAKEEAYLANLRANEAFSFEKDGVLMKEIESLKLWLYDKRYELKVKDRKIESLEAELAKARKIEALMVEKEQDTMVLISGNRTRIQELEWELERKESSESKMLELLANQSNELDSRIFELEESKIEAHLFLNTIQSLQELFERNCLDDLVQARESEKKTLKRAENLLHEMELLRKELKVSVEAEHKSSKALEDLTWALNEVAEESNQAQKNLSVTKAELEQEKVNAEELKYVMLSNDEKYEKLLHEAKQKTDLYKNMADRLSLEAEDAFLAWNEKEMGFVSCIKRAEDERAIAQHEKEKLAESLKSAEIMLKTAREETDQLRGLLREALLLKRKLQMT